MEIFKGENKTGVKRIDVVVDGKKYRPKFIFELQEVDSVPKCVCCGADGLQWQECVTNIIDYDTEDEIVMKEIEQKLKTMVSEIENAMAVCEDCYDDEFRRHRTKLYVDTVKKVTKEYNGEETDLSFLLKDNE